MNLDDYSYDLPAKQIAQRPASPRDSCKLLVINTGNDAIAHRKFSDIADYFSKGDVLVLNDTKVLHSKILGKKSTGSPAEVILIKKIRGKKNVYEAKIKTKNPVAGTKIISLHGCIEILSQKNIDTFIVSVDNEKMLDDAIMPTPPYIHGLLSDDQYQTIFSKKRKDGGSLAAPTAGLHFTKRLLEKIESKGVKIVYITLHVSYGTFKNIDNIATYTMDPETYEIPKSAAKTINNKKGKLFVCGTTTLKALETSSKNGKIIAGKGESKLFIYPPFKFNSGTDALITNFHLPKSTLLLLTSAFAGKDRIFKAYKEAVKMHYMFYSLGDSMIIFRPKIYK